MGRARSSARPRGPAPTTRRPSGRTKSADSAAGAARRRRSTACGGRMRSDGRRSTATARVRSRWRPPRHRGPGA
ncbi:MAG: hypothetical protein EA388_16180 [Nitriliruptor sp.]|nr:MAG: hypothetical protein EA388_16180 [Nitriliruptor sp.]